MAGVDPTGYASMPPEERQRDEKRRADTSSICFKSPGSCSLVGVVFGGRNQQSNGAERQQISGTTNSPATSAESIMGLSSRPTQCTAGDPAGLGPQWPIGVHRPLSAGEGLNLSWATHIHTLPFLSPEGKLIVRFFYDDAIDTISQTLDGNYGGAIVSAALFLFKPGKVADKVLDAGSSADNLVVDAYSTLSKSDHIPGQAHHLNQTAAFGDVIPRSAGQSIKLEGNILVDAGAPHTLAHQSLETFWNGFRGSSSVPTNLQYARALQDSLRAAGLSDLQVQQAVRTATKERVQYGLLGGLEVPRVPRPIRNMAE
jgi:hypothetical protein